MEPIPLAKPLLGREESDALVETIASGQVGPGPRVRAFEEAFARAHGARHGVACSNGTAALELALRALGIGAGDEVVVPAFTFVASANAVLAVGARPVFADVDPGSYTLDPADVRRVRTERTKAAIAVHLYGNPADVDAIREAGGVPVIEDCAQAHVAERKGKRVGALGAAGTFSFYPTKNMTTGEGGIVLTNDAAVADLARSYANHGRAPLAALGTYDHVRWGTNQRMTDLAAAIGLVQLRKVDAWTEARRANAAALTRGLAGAAPTPVERPGDRHVFHLYTIRARARDALLASLRKDGVGCGVYYPKALYLYPHLAPFARRCPESERATAEVASLPVHPSLSGSDLDRIVEATRRALEGSS